MFPELPPMTSAPLLGALEVDGRDDRFASICGRLVLALADGVIEINFNATRVPHETAQPVFVQ